MNNNLISILAKGNNAIPYRKELNKITGGALETLVFTQILYWFDVNSQEPFYKFIEPCEHPDYKEGDSWVEELGISRKQFLRIVKILEDNNLITRKTGMDRRTFHTVNVDVVNEKLKGIYINPKKELSKSQKGTYQVPKGDLDYSIIKNSEPTTEPTTEPNKKNLQKKIFSFTLKNKVAFKNLSVEYKQKLKEFILDYQQKYPNAMSYEDFENACIAKGYKYQDFKRAYQMWNAKIKQEHIANTELAMTDENNQPDFDEVMEDIYSTYGLVKTEKIEYVEVVNE